VDVDLARHLRRLLHVHIVVEEMLDGGHLAERLELVPEALRLRRRLFDFRLRTDAYDAIDRLRLMLSVEGRLALVVPELPGCLRAVPALRQKLHRSRHVRTLAFQRRHVGRCIFLSWLLTCWLWILVDDRPVRLINGLL